MLGYLTYDLSTVFLLLVLMTAALTDLRRNRIPNWLTYSALLIGLTLQSVFLGMDGLTTALAGAAVGLAIFLPFYLTGGMGAGDVKLMAAVGSLTTVKIAALSAAFGLCLGGVYALMLITSRGEWTAFLQRYAVAIHSKHISSPNTDSIAGRRFPFGVAIAGGCILALGWYSELDFYHLSSELSYQWQLWGEGQ